MSLGLLGCAAPRLLLQTCAAARTTIARSTPVVGHLVLSHLKPNTVPTTCVSPSLGSLPGAVTPLLGLRAVSCASALVASSLPASAARHFLHSASCLNLWYTAGDDEDC